VIASVCGTLLKASRPRGRSFEAKKRDRGSWSALSTFTANASFCVMTAHPSEVVPTQMSTSGGSSETDEKAFAVRP
jgi:hypothetical protein